MFAFFCKRQVEKGRETYGVTRLPPRIRGLTARLSVSIILIATKYETAKISIVIAAMLLSYLK